MLEISFCLANCNINVNIDVNINGNGNINVKKMKNKKNFKDFFNKIEINIPIDYFHFVIETMKILIIHEHKRH